MLGSHSPASRSSSTVASIFRGENPGTIENDHRNSGFSHEQWPFSIAMLVITRGYKWGIFDIFYPLPQLITGAAGEIQYVRNMEVFSAAAPYRFWLSTEQNFSGYPLVI